ncbi:hypothetical protein [Mycobacterium palustre]|uniref:Alpha/beta hydrolase n=1 Tax=Mycobacterium palustre TaxID=153971 RepID=A0A1X1Z333_9MYCO|nr:hypothetical protein [Mycobacterium palustre]MCV7099642.1 hypothetical protein [Mycobacterium palustre]ORW17686.1 hypothetical protein AWC19_20605 [Mycobacterium palustre]
MKGAAIVGAAGVAAWGAAPRERLTAGPTGERAASPRAYPGPGWVSVPDAGHLLNWEAADELIEVVKSFPSQRVTFAEG